MPRNGSGTYTRPQSDYTSGTTIVSAAVNSDLNDMASALTASLARDGQTTPTGNLPMGGFRHTNIANGVSRNEYAALGQAQDGAFLWGGTAGGTANAITVTLTPPITAYAAGQTFRFISSATNTSSVTLNVNGVGAVALNKGDGTSPLVSGEIPTQSIVSVTYDGTRFRLLNLDEFLPAGTGAVATTTQNKLRSFISLSDFGATENGTTNDVTAVNNAISAATAANIPLVLAQKNALYFTSTTIPNTMSLGNIASMAQGRNILANGNFNTWQRVDVRLLSPPVFNVLPPTFGVPSTYSGTSGVPVTTADLWVGRLFGLYGSFTVTRSQLTPQEAIVSPGSQFKANLTTTAVPPAAATNVTITAITSPTSSPVTVTAAGHGLSNGDYTYIKNNTYTGGSGTLTGTYQVSGVTANTFNITVTPDPGFVGFTSLGISTNDPFFETYAHVYDPSVPTWVRAGTGSYIFQYRAPDVQYNDGYYTVRVRMRRNSGTPVIRLRLFYDFGSGGSPTATTSSVALLMQPTTTDLLDYIACVKLPSISAATYGSTANTGYLAVSLEADPTTFNVDVFNVSVRPGVASLPNDNWPQHDALPYLQQFYQGAYVGTSAPVTAGRFYGTAHSFGHAMRGTPTVAFVRNVSISNFNSPTVDALTTSNGFFVSGEATATANLGRYVSIFEASYDIPT
jgi:hypothetical protein